MHLTGIEQITYSIYVPNKAYFPSVPRQTKFRISFPPLTSRLSKKPPFKPRSTIFSPNPNPSGEAARLLYALTLWSRDLVQPRNTKWLRKQNIDRPPGTLLTMEHVE